MMCPYCKDNISVFSKEMNKWGKEKFCPHCTKKIQFYIDFKNVVLLFIPAVLTALILKQWFISIGIRGSLATGIMTGIAVLMSLRIKKTDEDIEMNLGEERLIENPIRLHSKNGILIGTFFGGFLAAGYLISRNIKRLGDKSKSIMVLFLGAMGTVCFFIIMSYLPTEQWNVPKATYYIPQVIIVAILLELFHKEEISTHLKNNGSLESSWKAFGVSLICLLVSLLAAVVVVILFGVDIDA